MNVRVGGEIYVIPLASIIESLRPTAKDVRSLPGGGDVLLIRGEYVPLVYIGRLFGVANAASDATKSLVVLVEAGPGDKVGLVLDEIVGQQQVVIKSLESELSGPGGPLRRDHSRQRPSRPHHRRPGRPRHRARRRDASPRRLAAECPVSTGAIMIQKTAPEGAQTPAADLPAAFSEDTMQVVSFKVGQEHYGIDIQLVREIRAWQVATPLPNTPPFVRGVMNLRGTIVPVLDLRARFGQGTTEPSAAHVIIVVAVGTRIAGILVDAVSDIVTLAKSDIKPVPVMEGSAADDCLDGLVTVHEQMIALVSIERVASTH